MTTKRFYLLCLPVLCGFLSSCSRPARARRYIEKSDQAYQQAKAHLSDGDMKKAKGLADRSLALAEKAASLVPEGPLHETIEKKTRTAGFLAGAFEDPVKAFLLWSDSILQGDMDMSLLLFDYRRLLTESCGDRLAPMSQEKKSQLEEMIARSVVRTISDYSELLANWKTTESKGSVTGEDAVVQCTIQALDRVREMRFWLHRGEGLWKVYDFTVGKDRVTEDFAAMMGRLDRDEDLVEFFRGKGLFEAFSQIKDATSMDVVYMRKPLIGRYVRAKEPLDATRKGAAEKIEAGALLKVIDQTVGSQGRKELVVRTTEPSISGAAVARVPEDSTVYEGSDENAVWGVFTSDIDSE